MTTKVILIHKSGQIRKLLDVILTSVDQILICNTRMVYVMDCWGKEGRKDFQGSEHILLEWRGGEMGTLLFSN